MHSKKILLLGSAGFVGTCLLNRLNHSAHTVYDISTTKKKSFISNNNKSFVSSLDNKKLLEHILPECDIVFYLASHSTPGVSANKPTLEAESNLLPCLRFLEIMEKQKKILFVYLSSGGAVYGDSQVNRYTEDLPLKPLSYYGAGKAAIEKFLLAYQSQTNNRILILRPSNFYGPGQLVREGFGIIPTIFSKLLKNEPLVLWGDGQVVRDYLYIDDFLDLCEIIIMKESEPALRRRIYNVGSGFGVTLIGLCDSIEELTGKQVKIHFEKSRAVDVKHSILDCSRIINDYLWTPKVDVKNGLQRTWSWFNEVYS